jgi:hypothetical protein
MAAPVYCMFCKHCKYPAPNGLPEACRHPDGPRDPVKGKMPTCVSMRATHGMCGPSGKMYEKRPPAEVKPKKPNILTRAYRAIVRRK